MKGANGGRRQRRTASTRIGFSATVSARSHDGAPRIAIPGRPPTTTHAARARTTPSIVRAAMFHVKPFAAGIRPQHQDRQFHRVVPGPPKHRIGHGKTARPACRQWQVAQPHVPSTGNSFPGPGENGRVQCVQAPGRFQWNDARPGQRGPAVTQGRCWGPIRACSPRPDLRTARHDQMFHVKRAHQP